MDPKVDLVSGVPRDMMESLVFQDSQESQGPQDIPQEVSCLHIWLEDFLTKQEPSMP